VYDQLKEELVKWKLKQLQKPSVFNRNSKRVQRKVNEYIPKKVHDVVTESIKKMVQATIAGNEFFPKKTYSKNLTLLEKESELKNVIKAYQKTAAIEGVGTGAGGIFLGLADFPLLLGIKMKFLFEAAALYGFDTTKYEERIFLLHVFQLAYSSEEYKASLLKTIENWELNKPTDVDWKTFQQEYRDYIDLVKLFQVVPGIGAIVGGVANYQLVNHLGECVKYSFRMRLLQNHDIPIGE